MSYRTFAGTEAGHLSVFHQDHVDKAVAEQDAFSASIQNQDLYFTVTTGSRKIVSCHSKGKRVRWAK